MQRLLGALLALLISGTAAFADSTPGALGVATSTLVGGKLPFDQGPGTDTALGFTTTQFCLTGGALVICNNAITNAMLAGSIDPAKLTVGTGVATALGINVGSAGAFLKNNGDAITGTYTGAPTFSGNLTFSGIPKLTGLSAGTQVSCLGLDSGNSIVLLASACGSGGGGTGTVTNAANLTDHAPVIGSGGTVGVKTIAALTNGQVMCGATAADPTACTISGDGTMAAGGALTITKTSGTTFSSLATTTPGTGVATALGVNVGTAGAFAKNNGDALSGTYTGTPTFSGNITLSGAAPLMTGLSAGTQTKCLGLTSGNVIVYVASACGTASLTTTDGTNSVASTTTMTFGAGFVVGGSAGSATVSQTNTQNDQSGATYTLLTTDGGKTVDMTNGSATTITGISAASAGVGYATDIFCDAGCTINRASTDTYNGATSIVAAAHQLVHLEAPTSGGGWRFGILPALDPSNATNLISGTVAAARGGAGTSNGILKANGSGTVSAATAGTDYAPAISVLATGTSVSLTAPRQYYICTGTCTVTPPVPAAGYEFCVANSDNVTSVITLAAIGSSARYENTARTAYGTAGTGTFVSGGAAGDKVCLLGLDSTHYLTVSFNGTWTAN